MLVGLPNQPGSVGAPGTVIYTPRYLKLETTSTATPPMHRGGRGRLSLLKSTTISLVFFILMQRLLPLHHCTRCSTSSLYSDSSLSMMRPTTAVSSANFTIWQLGCLAEQSYVSRVNRRGLSTQPYGEPVLRAV